MSSERLAASLRLALHELQLGQRRVLDLCCGPGRHLAHFGPGSLGLDRNPEAVQRATAGGLEVREVDLMHPGWSTAVGARPFEAAWACDALVHLPDPGVALDELGRCLEDGAPLVVVEWCLPEGRAAARIARAFPGARAHFAHPEHLHRFTERSLRDLVAAHGFEPERVVTHGLPSPLRALLGPLADLIPPRSLIARRRA